MIGFRIGPSRPKLSRTCPSWRTEQHMDLLAIIRIAMRALARNKMRSVLTMLGIIIGVGAVIAMLGVGQGAQQTMQEQIQAMGSNMLFVGAGTVTRSGMHMGWGSTKSLIYDDMLAIMRECPAAHAAAPGRHQNVRRLFAHGTGGHAQ